MSRLATTMALGLLAMPLGAADLTLSVGGRVVVELIGSEAAFRNTLSVTTGNVAVALSGCGLEPAVGLGGTHIVSEKLSQRGCRAELDSDAGTAGIQPFAMNAVLRFGFCAQTNADPACEFVWSSDLGSNSDGDDHVRTVNLGVASGFAARLSWEDQENLGDQDFDDLVVVVRVAADADGDGLWDDWETSGVDSNGDGTVDLDLPALGANPQHKDVFVEIDWMDCAVMGGDCAAGDTHSHQPQAAALQAVIAAFAAADVMNPDGNPGIALHLETSNAVAHQNTLIIPNLCITGPANTGFDAVKADPANFGPANPRRFTHHYNLWTHRMDAQGTSGCAELPGNDVQVSLGGWNYFCAGGTRNNLFCVSNANCPGMGASCQPSGDIDGDGTADQDLGTVQQQAGTLAHELGHNLNLGHGGGDWTNNKPNYLSVMNYTFQMPGIPPTDPDGGMGPLRARVDYSPDVLPTLTENNLSEPAGIGDGTDNTFYACPGSGQLNGTGVGNAVINWNCDTNAMGLPDATDVNLSQDLNLDATTDCVRAGMNGALDTAAAVDDVVFGTNRLREGPNRRCDSVAGGDDVQWRPTGPLVGYDDWANIKYDFQNAGSFDDGQHVPIPAQLDELTLEAFSTSFEADVAVAAAATPATVLTGSAVTIALTVTNTKPNAAQGVVVTLNLPPGTGFLSCFAGGGGVCGGSGNSRTVSFAVLPGGETALATIEALVACNLPDGTALSFPATVSAVRNIDPANDSATASVMASNPPPQISGLAASPAQLWPPNHKMRDVAVTYQVTDNCGVPVNTLSVSSNEPVDGDGDGNTAPDWEVLGPNQVRLRAERSGRGTGRIYTISLESVDGGGGASNASTLVVVPHDR